MTEEMLDWKLHIDHVCSKLPRSIGVLSKLKNFLPKHILCNIYYPIVFLHFNYCNMIWSNTHDSQIVIAITIGIIFHSNHGIFCPCEHKLESQIAVRISSVNGLTSKT